MTTGALVVYCAAIVLEHTSRSAALVPAIIGVATGILIVFGLWTPVAGTLIAVLEAWNIFIRSTSPLISITLGILGATLAMIGPGA